MFFLSFKNKKWQNKKGKRIFLLKYVQFVAFPSLGAKNGQNAGMMLNIVRIVVADAKTNQN
jgi:hypothetical protein